MCRFELDETASAMLGVDGNMSVETGADKMAFPESQAIYIGYALVELKEILMQVITEECNWADLCVFRMHCLSGFFWPMSTY